MPDAVHDADSTQVDEEQRNFYELLGRAIARWAFVEEGIYHIYRRITGPMEWPAAAAGFHAVVNTGTKLDMVTAAMATSPTNAAHVDEWSVLNEKIRENAARRARLAHWTVAQGHDGRQQGVITHLEAPIYDISGKGADGEPVRIYAKQIAEWTAGFADLADDLDKFWRKISWPH